jgi:hypothetical protein
VVNPLNPIVSLSGDGLTPVAGGSDPPRG